MIDPFSFIMGAIAALAVCVLFNVAAAKPSDQSSRTAASDLQPRRVVSASWATESDVKIMVERLTKEIEEVKLVVNTHPVRPVAIEIPDFVTDELIRRVMFAVVVACRAERVKMSDKDIEKYRMGWWVQANKLADLAKRNPIDDIKRPA